MNTKLINTKKNFVPLLAQNPSDATVGAIVKMFLYACAMHIVYVPLNIRLLDCGPKFTPKFNILNYFISMTFYDENLTFE